MSGWIGQLTERRELSRFLFCFFCAAGLLLIHSASSPLYVFNDWADPNAFLTVGKGMLQGLVPYRDLFEQKGPLLYLLHGIAYLFDRTGFFGVYLLEVSAMTATLFLSAKLCKRFLPPVLSWFLPPILSFVMLTSRAFVSGDSAEELCTPLTLGLFCLVISNRPGHPGLTINADKAFWAGFLGGCVLMIKFVLLGGWAGFALTLVVILIIRRQFVKLIEMLAFAALGLFCAVAPWLVYFAWHRALDDFVDTYFLINFKLYDKSTGLMDRLANTWSGAGKSAQSNILITALLVVAVAAILFNKPPFKSRGLKAAFLASLSIQLFLSYAGGRDYTYYFLSMAPYAMFGLVAFLAVIVPARPARTRNRRFRQMLVADLLLVIFGLSLIMSPNLYQSDLRVADYPQFTFAEIINQEQDASILNYGFLDGGFYTAADITPAFKYFMRNNIPLADMYYEQQRYVAEGLTTFVIVRTGAGMQTSWEDIPGLDEQYELIAEQGLVYADTGYPYNYLLYRKKQ